MIDPQDPGTLDLKAPELAVLAIALGEFRQRWAQVPSKLKAAEALLPRLPLPAITTAFPGDSAWLADAAQRGETFADWPASTRYQADMGYLDLLQYRQTPHGQPEVDGLVVPGDTVWTSYGSGPYVVKAVNPYDCQGLRCFSLVLLDLGGEGRRRKREADGWINEVVAVDGRLLKLFTRNEDEVFVARHALAAGFVEVDEAAAVRAECRRIMCEGHAAYDRTMAGQQDVAPSFDELAVKLLSFKDRRLLDWARRNEQLVRETPAEQAYPHDPQARNLLGQALADQHELNGRYQVLLEQALELYELTDLGRHTPRLSSPAAFLRDYKRHSESHAIAAATEGVAWARERFKGFGQPPAAFDNTWQTRAEAAEAELAHIRGELEQLGQEVQYRRTNDQAAALYNSQEQAPSLRVAGLEQENALLEAERNGALGAIEVYVARLKQAGLSTDYRRQPGE